MKLKNIAVAILAAISGMSYAGQPVPLAMPTGPGGLANMVAIAIQPSINKNLDADTVTVLDFKPGGSGLVAIQHVIDYPTAAFYVGPVQASLPANLQTEKLIPVIDFSANSAFVVSNPNIGAKTLKELLASGKKSISIGFPNGSAQENYVRGLAAFRKDIEIIPVPYKSGGELSTAIMGGHIDAGIIAGPVVAPAVKEGKMVALANLSDTRSHLLPNVTGVHEQGIVFDKDITGFTVFMLWANQNTDKALIEKVRKEFGTWTRTKEGQDFLKQYDFPTNNPDLLKPEVVLKKMLK